MTTLLSVCMLATAHYGQTTFEPINADFVRPATRSRLGQPTWDEAMSQWPQPVGVNAFTNQRIPAALRDDANLWIRRAIAEQLLPSDLGSRFKGCRLTKSDLIYVRYQATSTVKLQIIENEVGIHILFKDSSLVSILSSELIENYARSVAVSCFKLTAIQRERMTITSKHWPNPQPEGFWKGTLHIQDTGLSYEQMGWWHQISFETDGDSIEYFVRKWMPGDHPMDGAKGPGPLETPYRGRFDSPE